MASSLVDVSLRLECFSRVNALYLGYKVLMGDGESAKKYGLIGQPGKTDAL